LRGTVSTGFHAPSLAQLGNQSSGYTSNWSNSGTGVFAPGRTRVFRSADPAAAAFGAKALDPEESTTYSAGVVFRPDATSSVTIDAYRLRIKDVIQVSETVQGPTVTAAFNAAGLVGYTQASYYLNAWDSTTQGVDIVARKQFKFDRSDLQLTAATSFLETEVDNVNRNVNVGGTDVIAIRNAKVRDAESGTPKNKVILNGRYAFGDWSGDATVTRYSKYRYNVGDVAGVAAANGNVDQVFSPETYLDLGFSYASPASWRLDVLVQNVLNDYPDKYALGNRASGINPYSFIAPNGASGRFIQGSLTYSF
jgi:iron complex outermembrane receptor protein